MTAVDPVVQQAHADIGGYVLTVYSSASHTLHAANAVSALGALAGVFAQLQARALLMSGAIAQTETTLLEVGAVDGGVYYFGDAINACVMEGTRERPSFWNIAAGAGKDPEIGRKIDVAEIAQHSAASLGTAAFGAPRLDARYQLSETPVDAVKRHAPVLSRRFTEIALPQNQLVLAFGLAAQGLATFAAGEQADVPVVVAMPRDVIVRLYMEAAIPMSKIDPKSVGL